MYDSIKALLRITGHVNIKSNTEKAAGDVTVYETTLDTVFSKELQIGGLTSIIPISIYIFSRLEMGKERGEKKMMQMK